MNKNQNGVLLGAASLLLWSTSAATTVLFGGRAGAWQFLALATLFAGLLQTAFCRLHLGMPLKNIFAPPPKLLALILGTFTLNMVAYTLALVSADKSQKVGVGLLNFLWPTLTVVFAAFLVPGSKMTGRLAFALALAFGGVLVANFDGIKSFCVDISPPCSSIPVETSLFPYLLGLTAGVTWAVYSAMLARWKSWAGQYATCPLGFLTSAAIAFAVCAFKAGWAPLDAVSWAGILYMALGPLAAAYLLWELALHRAPPRILGLMASGKNILAVLFLFTVTRFMPGAGAPPNLLHTALATILVTAAIALGREKTKEDGVSDPSRQASNVASGT